MKKLYLIGFDEFWKAYPRRVAKGAAMKSWNRIAPNDILLDEILKAIEIQKRSSQWQKDGGQFIPHPSTWLNQMRWEDEVDNNIFLGSKATVIN